MINISTTWNSMPPIGCDPEGTKFHCPQWTIAISSTLEVDQAKEIAMTALGLNSAEFNENEACGKKGIYQVESNPQKSRIAYELCLKAGDQKKDIKVYVDTETHAILDIF